MTAAPKQQAASRLVSGRKRARGLWCTIAQSLNRPCEYWTAGCLFGHEEEHTLWQAVLRFIRTGVWDHVMRSHVRERNFTTPLNECRTSFVKVRPAQYDVNVLSLHTETI